MKVQTQQQSPQPYQPLVAEVANSIGFIRAAKKGDISKSDEVSPQSRINEQELFSALIHLQLKKRGDKTAEFFGNTLVKKLTKMRVADPINYVLKATRRAMRSLRIEKLMSRSDLKEARQYALGLAQLDDDRTRLSVSRISRESKETPLRAVKTALAKLLQNVPATNEELALFKDNFRKEIQG